METPENPLIPPSGKISERLAEVETEARALRRLLKLAVDREQESRRRIESRRTANRMQHSVE